MIGLPHEFLKAALVAVFLRASGAKPNLVPVEQTRAYLRGASPIRIGLAVGAPRVDFVSGQVVTIAAAGERKISTASAGRPVSAVSAPSAELLCEQAGAVWRAAQLQATRAGVHIGESPPASYPGIIEIRPDALGLTVVNAVPIEDYLRGVLPSEMPVSFHMEALKAQAVAARSYALHELGRHASEGFDLCSTYHCQVYRGDSLSQRPPGLKRSDDAIRAARGLILSYRGFVAKPVYHSTCGGATEDVWNVWANHLLPYLRGRSDEWGTSSPLAGEEAACRFLASDGRAFCRASRRFRWRVEFSLEELGEKFRANMPLLGFSGAQPGRILDIAVERRSRSGRVEALSISTEAGVFRVWRDNIRWLFGTGKPGPGGLPSTFFCLKRREGSIVLTGAGWGHGAGMCQIGAQGRAKAGQNFRQILASYYTGVELVRP
jgi:stage II sporulation protein D